MTDIPSFLGQSTCAVLERETFVGKVLLFIPLEDEVLAAGYTHVRVERRTSPSAAWEEVTRSTAPSTRIAIRSGTYNYFFQDPHAKSSYEYEPVLMGTGVPDLRQGIYAAQDASYENVLSVEQLKTNYLYGLEGALSNDAGAPLPDSVYRGYILAAIAKFEQKVLVRVLPTKFLELHDWYPDDVREGFFFNLDEYPVINIESVTLQLPGTSPQEMPASWVSLQRDMGQLHMLPDGSNLSFGGGVWAGSRQRFSRMVPNAFAIQYNAGFSPFGVRIPANVVDTVAKEAALGPLNIGGDLLGGAGIASQSISLDGLSTSATTTSSATNAGFGARIIQYQKELKEQYKEMRAFYKRIRMAVA